MSDIVFLYVTAPNAEVAARLARTLVEEKSAACVNILGEMRSLYEWEGKTENILETPLLVKTTASAADKARQRIIELHPYDAPCIAAIPISETGSNGVFLDWIRANTAA